ncbi:MAG TPA: hypothetical protein VK778_01600 [Solirubrobacteraceae bacterium]|nr:hypothetical protein [Solirubrobacteraceae bacterium]
MASGQEPQPAHLVHGDPQLGMAGPPAIGACTIGSASVLGSTTPAITP